MMEAAASAFAGKDEDDLCKLKSADQEVAAATAARDEEELLLATGYALPQAEKSKETYRSGSPGLPVSPEVLSEVAATIYNHWQCIQLAIKLKLNADLVAWVVHVENFRSGLPFNVLTKWRQTKYDEATGPVLYTALCDMGRKEVAERFAGKLLTEEEHQEVSYKLTQSAPPPEAQESGSFDVSRSIPTLDLLLELAQSLEKVKYAAHLARELDLGYNFSERTRSNAAHSCEVIAMRVLHRWLEEKAGSATSKVLFDALVASKRKAVAASFAERLLGKANTDWEEFCYNDEYRDLYRILRDNTVDIVATYECMRCTPKFLHYLQTMDVLEKNEYEKLAASVRELPRTSVNKMLMDIVNMKSVEVKHAFAQEARRFQPQIVRDEDHKTDSAELAQADLVARELSGEELLDDFKEELVKSFKQMISARPVEFIAQPAEFEACDKIAYVRDSEIALLPISYEDVTKLIHRPNQLSPSELLSSSRKSAPHPKHIKDVIGVEALIGNTDMKSALILGMSGSGKSLTVLKILSEWIGEAKSAVKQFGMVVLVTGRETTRLNAKAVEDFFQLWRLGYNERQQRYILDYFKESEDAKSVLILIDGWNEGGEACLLQDGTVLKDMLRGERSKLFPGCSVIITSRPTESIYPLLEECDARYNLLGLSNQQLRQLLSRRLNEKSQASRLFNTLSQPSHQHIKSAVQNTPLFSAILVNWYKFRETIPPTITALYKDMLNSVRDRYLDSVTDSGEEEMSGLVMTDKKKRPLAYDRVHRQLNSLALACWMNKQVTLNSEEVRLQCGEQAVDGKFGLLSEVNQVGGHRGRVIYHFAHLSFQKYLAASSLATDKDFIKKLRMCIRDIGLGEHSRLFWQFLAGLIEPRLLPDIVFELLKGTGVSGNAPWETEVRLFLVNCMAESIRMQQRFYGGEEVLPDHVRYIRLAGELLSSVGGLVINGCCLDATNLSSLSLMLSACANITHYRVVNCRIEQHSFIHHSAFHQLQNIELFALTGEGATTYFRNVTTELLNSKVIQSYVCRHVTSSAPCLEAVGKLITTNESLRELMLFDCKIGLHGMERLSNSVHHSSSLAKFIVADDELSGTGLIVGDMCSRLSRLQILQLPRCQLKDEDAASILVGLESSTYLEEVHLENNNLTDKIMPKLLEHATARDSLVRAEAARRVRLPPLAILVAGNRLSEDALTRSSSEIRPTSRVKIDNGRIAVEGFVVEEVNHSLTVKHLLDSSSDGHLEWAVPGASDRGAMQIAHELETEHNKGLRSLYLPDCDIGDEGVTAIASALLQCQLKSLDLSANKFTWKGFQPLLAALSGNCVLEYLNVGRNRIFTAASSPPRDCSVLELALSVQNLKYLSVSQTKYADDCDSLDQSPLALMAVPSLIALDASDNAITDKSVTMVMPHLGELKYLSLSGNKITAKGAKALMETIQALLEKAQIYEDAASGLQRIWLGGNRIKEEFFSNCKCRIISGDSFSVQQTMPKYVGLIFSSLAHDQRTPDDERAFWLKMNRDMRSQAFNDCLNFFCQNRETAFFDRWLSIAFQSLSYKDKSQDRLRQAKALVHLFHKLFEWYYERRRNTIMALSVFSSLVCVVEELVVVESLTSLRRYANEAMEAMAKISFHDKYLIDIVCENLRLLAERCHRRQLDNVAEALGERIKYLQRQAKSASVI